MDLGVGGCHGMDGKAFRNKVRQLIDDSGAPDLQSFCYWTLHHAFHLWNSEHYVFGNSKDDTDSEMSAAKWLMELKTQSEADIRSVSSQKSKFSENSNAGLKLTETISKSENNKDVCISESVFVRRRGNVLLSLDGMVLPSSELAQESAPESPLSVVFKGMDTRFCEAADAEGIARNEEEQDRNEGFVASTSKLEAETQQNFSGGDVEECSDLLLEVYLGEDEDDEVAYLTSKCATK